jgi:hypothetical protein
VIALPAGIGQTFRLAAGELGFCAATRLFMRSLGETPEAVDALREALGREYPVLDAITARWLDGGRGDSVDATAVTRVLAGCRTVLVVGLETDHLDALVDQSPDVQFRLLANSALPVDWDRVEANYAGRLQVVTLDAVFEHAGHASGVLCFAYGSKAETLYVPQAWMRFFGRDIRPLFRSFVAWNVLPAPFEVYPRWLVASPAHDFTDIVVSA